LLYGQSQCSPFLPLAFVSLLLIAGCSGLSPLSLLTGGGPNVAANTQLGQENEQTVGLRSSNEQTITRPQARDITQTADKGVKAESIEKVTVQNIPPWVLVLLVLGWLLPSPGEIGRKVRLLWQKTQD
jgi:hypothetical protein